MSELKPCPFCGGEPTSSNEFDDEVLFYGCTKDIDCPMYDAPFVNLENWNTRPIEDALNARIAELEAAQRWIPVSEPPKVSGKYLLLNIYDDVYPCDFIAGTEIWVLPDYDTITHWMPLPTPPEGKE